MNRRALLAAFSCLWLAPIACDTSGCPEGRCLDEVAVPTGQVTMECDPADEDCLEHDAPPVQVSVPAFHIDRYEATVGELVAFLNARGEERNTCGGGRCVNTAAPDAPVEEVDGAWQAKAGAGANHPATQVTWYGADAFCRWRGQSLCSEAQWARAARGDDGRVYPWGDTVPSCDNGLAHLAADEKTDEVEVLVGCGTGRTAPVGDYPDGVSPFGVHDLSGNVEEWVADPYHESYDGAPTDGSVWTEGGDGGLRTIRGGDAKDPPEYVRATSRHAGGPGDGGRFRGFRCCR